MSLRNIRKRQQNPGQVMNSCLRIVEIIYPESTCPQLRHFAIGAGHASIIPVSLWRFARGDRRQGVVSSPVQSAVKLRRQHSTLEDGN